MVRAGNSFYLVQFTDLVRVFPGKKSTAVTATLALTILFMLHVVFSSELQSVLLEVKHPSNATCSPVVITHKSGSSSLHILQPVNVVEIRVPRYGTAPA